MVHESIGSVVGDAVSWGVCSDGYLHLATRPETTCEGCGEPIESGAVGLASGCVPFHKTGYVDYQHDCGVWNGPTEVSAPVNGDVAIVARRLMSELSALT